MKKWFLLFVASCSFSIGYSQNSVTLTGWVFKPGDHPERSANWLPDTSWAKIRTGMTWENLGYANYDGYAWYRVHFWLPKSILENSVLKDRIRIHLGQIDDCDQVFLNGKMIGQTGRFPEEEGGYQTAWDVVRNYDLRADDPIFRWDWENILAVRVYDGGGPGGIFSGEANIATLDLINFVELDDETDSWHFQPDKMGKQIRIENNWKEPIKGTVRVAFSRKRSKNQPFSQPVEIPAGGSQVVDFQGVREENAPLVISFIEEKSGRSIEHRRMTPYLLTPPVLKEPRFNYPRIYGARPGHEIIFTLPVSGDRPMKFSCDNLPKTLKLDKKTGVLTGQMAERGELVLNFEAENKFGKAAGSLKLVVGDELALTPPMGWNSWNCWGLSVSDEKVRSSAQAMIDKGLTQHGFAFMNIDDGWEAPHRTNDSLLLANEKFPDMKKLADFIHKNGLKLGIYSSPGPTTCGGYLASWKNEAQDVATWADWGIDYLKYDWCSYGQIAPEKPSLAELKKPYFLMNDLLKKAPRDIVFSLCQYGMGDVHEWGNEVGGHLWRTTGDITDSWASLKSIGFSQSKMSKNGGPGGWNDPDMLIVGKVGWGERLHATRLSATEQYTHISLWAMLSAPLLLGCDLAQLDEFTLNLLTNDEVIALNQDEKGSPARLFETEIKPGFQIWTKDLADGSRAIGIFNLNDRDDTFEIPFAELGISDPEHSRDVWRQQELGAFYKNYGPVISAHGVLLLRGR